MDPHSNGNQSKPPAWPMDRLRSRAPEIGRAFGPFFKELMKDGALSAKQKELISVGIAVATHCPPCIDAHVDKCLKIGVTDAEIMEAAGVGVLMGGGPAYMHAALVAAALDRHAQVTDAAAGA